MVHQFAAFEAAAPAQIAISLRILGKTMWFRRESIAQNLPLAAK
jgi:hypothetical protein